MRKIINPQIFFLYNNKLQIKNTFFLTYKNEEELKKTKEYQLFIFYQNKYPSIFSCKNFEIINDHILLTLTVGEIRGYIQREILKTDLKILVFSLWDNIDYKYKNNYIFNPFEKNQNYINTPNDTIIYEIYKNIFITAVFCVIDEENYFNPELCSNGIYNKYIKSFTNEILSQDLDNITDINIKYEENVNLQYNIKWSDNILYDIKSIDMYKKNINEYYYDNYFVSGDELILMNNINDLKILKDTTYTNVIIYEKYINEDFINIYNDVIYINDFVKYKNLIYIFPILENIILKKKINKEKYRIEFDINIKNKITIFYENNFFIFETKKTKNIFLDRSKKINIMISKDHIFFNGYNLNFELCVYLTKMIIGYQILKKNAEFIIYNKKMGSRYYSRYCQTIKNPSIIENFNPEDTNYKNINNIYFEHLYGGNDVYYDIEKQKYVSCLNPDLSNISFINELYQGYNICLPCCYKKKKNKTLIFSNCTQGTFNDDIDKPYIISEPYIHIFKTYRIIMDNNKIGCLIGKLKSLFNQNTQISYFKKNIIKNYNFSDICTDEDKKILNILKNIKKNYHFNKMKKDNMFVEHCFFNNNLDEINEIDEIDLNDKNKYIDLNDLNDNDINNSGKNNYIDLNDLNDNDINNSGKNTNFKNLYKYINNFEQYIFINKNKRILLAKNYIIYVFNKKKKNIDDIQNILHDEELNIYFLDDNMYFNPKILNIYKNNKEYFIKNVNFYLIIKNIVHVLKSITKLNINDDLIIEDIPYNIKKNIINKYLNIDNFIFKKQENNLLFSNKGYYINEQEIKSDLKTKYLYYIPKILLNKYSIGYYIVNVLYKKYFSIFYYLNEDDDILIKKTFLSNLSSIMNKNITYDKIFIFDIYKDVIKEIIEILNPKFINEKELKKYIKN